MREDVMKFAKFMSDALDSKQVERETRNDPHYTSAEYQFEQAFACLQDKTDQLGFEIQNRSTRRERLLKTAVHLANFAMIIALKSENGQ